MDVEIWLYFMLPLFATIAGAVYAAQRDQAQHANHEQRIAQLEQCESHRNGVESVTDRALITGQVTANTQLVNNLAERVGHLEEEWSS